MPVKFTVCDANALSASSLSCDTKLSDPVPLMTPAVAVLSVKLALPDAPAASGPGVVAVTPAGRPLADDTSVSVSAPDAPLVMPMLPVGLAAPWRTAPKLTVLPDKLAIASA